MVQCMKVNGKMICNTVKVLRHGLIRVDTKVSITMEGNTVLVLTYGVMEVNIQAIGERIK
jgi:hypothetical protein